MLDQPVDLPLTSWAQPRAVLPVMVTRAPSLRTLITWYERLGPVRRLRAVVVTLTVPAPIFFGAGRSAPLLRYLLATYAVEPANLILVQPCELLMTVTVWPR